MESPSESDRADRFDNFFRMRSISHMSVGSSTSNDPDENGTNGSPNDTNGTTNGTTNVTDRSNGSTEDDQNHQKMFKRQITTGSIHNDQDIKLFQDKLEKKAKPSNLSSELNNHHDTSILGKCMKNIKDSFLAKLLEDLNHLKHHWPKILTKV